MSRGFALRIALILGALALTEGAASAQTSGPAAGVGPDAATQANDFFRAAMVDVKAKRWAEAEQKFLAALALNPSYDIASNLGQTQYRLEKYRDAAENLAFALRSWPLTAKLDHRDLAVRRLAELRALVASLTITVNKPGAVVLVDGKDIGRSPLRAEVFVDPGPRIIEASLQGYQGAKQAIEAAKGSATNVTLTLKEAAPAPTAPTPVASAPKGPNVESGAAESTAKTSKAGPDAAPQAPGTGPANEKAANEGGPRFGIILAGSSAAALGVVGGVVFTTLANMRLSDARDQRSVLLAKGGSQPCLIPSNAAACSEMDASFKATDTFTDAAVGSFLAGGALAVGTIIYVVVARRAPVKAAPTIAPGKAGLIVSGVW